MAAVFTENMNKLDLNDTAGSLKTIESYIRYMQERVEYSTKGVTRIVSEAGVSSAQLYTTVLELGNILSALSSRVNDLDGQMNSINANITALSDRMTKLEQGVASQTQKIAALEDRISMMEQNIDNSENTENGG